MSSLEKEKQPPSWADRHFGKALLGVLTLFIAGCFHLLWTSDVEDALLKGLEDKSSLAFQVNAVQCEDPKDGQVSCIAKYLANTPLERGLPVYVDAVQCDSPENGLVACEVTYVKDTTLSPVQVKVEVAKAPFPGDFNIYHQGERRTLRTSFEGHEMGIQSGVAALQASITAVTTAANSSLGPKLQEGLNALSYSLGEEVSAPPQRIDVPPEAARAALAVMQRAVE